MRAILLWAFVLALAPGAAAQDLPARLRPLRFTFTAEQTPPPAPKPDQFDVGMFVYTATAGADWAITAVCMEIICDPENPVGMVWFGIDDPKIAVPIGLALDAVILFSVHRFIKPKHPTVASTILWLLSTVRTVVLTQRIGDLRHRTGDAEVPTEPTLQLRARIRLRP